MLHREERAQEQVIVESEKQKQLAFAQMKQLKLPLSRLGNHKYETSPCDRVHITMAVAQNIQILSCVTYL